MWCFLFFLERTQAVKDLEAFKSQSEGVAREYDRLSEEHSKLQKKMAILEGEDGSDKKDDWTVLWLLYYCVKFW